MVRNMNDAGSCRVIFLQLAAEQPQQPPTAAFAFAVVPLVGDTKL